MDRSLITEFDRLAWLVATDGIVRHQWALSRAVTQARHQGWHGVALDVVADPNQPEVARQRALGRLRPARAARAARPAA